MWSTVRARIIVRGRVQGVSFRVSVCAEAARSGITGWVRNEPDGSVALEAQGTVIALDHLLAWCGRGPPGARVSGIETEWLEPRADEGRFEIRH
jgi:acylphosphatase